MNPLYKVLLVDDEENSLKVSEIMIGRHCPNFTIVGKARTIDGAVDLINKHEPDLVLLDIEMTNESGFDLLVKCPPINFEVVFLTAYSEYALQAFKASAVDYLLKPLAAVDLVKAFALVVEKRLLQGNVERYNKLLDYLEASKQKNQTTHNRIAISNKNGFTFIDVNQIVAVKAEAEYAKITTLDGKKYFYSKSMKVIEEQFLTDEKFFKTHRSHIINTDYIKELVTRNNSAVIMQIGDKIPLARNRKPDLFKLLKL